MRIEDLAAPFAAIFGPLYKTAYLRRFDYEKDGKGGAKRTPDEWLCKAQIDRAGSRVNVDGYAEGDMTILILSDGLPVPVKDDDEITIEGATFRLSGPETDPLGTHWRARGRRKP
jgi:hypothetical protein